MLKNTGLKTVWIAILLIVLDRLAKMSALSYLTYDEPLKLLPVLNLTLVYNTGAAFSFLSTASGWQILFLGMLAFVVSVFLLIWLYKVSPKDRWLCFSLNLILGGALGNAWDRVLYGHVIDFFDFHINEWHFAVFNTADAFISVGAVILFFHWWQEK